MYEDSGQAKKYGELISVIDAVEKSTASGTPQISYIDMSQTLEPAPAAQEIHYLDTIKEIYDIETVVPPQQKKGKGMAASSPAGAAGQPLSQQPAAQPFQMPKVSIPTEEITGRMAKEEQAAKKELQGVVGKLSQYHSDVISAAKKMGPPRKPMPLQVVEEEKPEPLAVSAPMEIRPPQPKKAPTPQKVEKPKVAPPVQQPKVAPVQQPKPAEVQKPPQPARETPKAQVFTPPSMEKPKPAVVAPAPKPAPQPAPPEPIVMVPEIRPVINLPKPQIKEKYKDNVMIRLPIAEQVSELDKIAEGIRENVFSSDQISIIRQEIAGFLDYLEETPAVPSSNADPYLVSLIDARYQKVLEVSRLLKL